MCSSKSRVHQGTTNIVAKINGRPVLQPKSNQVPSLERRNSLKKNPPKSPTLQPALPPPLSPPPTATAGNKAKPSLLSPPISPKLRSPRPPAVKRGSDSNVLNSSSEKVMTPRSTTRAAASMVKKSRKTSVAGVAHSVEPCGMKHSSSSITVEAPGSIAAARREQVAIMQEQRKSRIAHYGRTKSSKYHGKIVPVDLRAATSREEKRCSFITPNSDPIYVAYHDEEWGVPVHDDKMLFELLVLTGAQVGSDWTSVLKKRQAFRDAFSGFDAEIVAKLSEKKIMSISAEYGIDTSLVRGVVDNASRVLQIKREFGSFNKYLWGFVNHKTICTQYKSCQKIPVKTSKSETISKDMVKRGFRLVGPTVIHSFMQAAGLSNDHLITCPRYLECIALASQHSTLAPAL
ncbi:hypothetical protein Tsubulata_005884 [Turnera subulata]|uniref:Uncharacterized protein n=1 Tax=Turnera subulata TaxID=218843 RepID=A0A9Q0JJJ7_9ROSI|nr:hypothetical protein Tsubulata_005884 [Turnera subulata]